jgi:hypothetical protein
MADSPHNVVVVGAGLGESATDLWPGFTGRSRDGPAQPVFAVGQVMRGGHGIGPGTHLIVAAWCSTTVPRHASRVFWSLSRWVCSALRRCCAGGRNGRHRQGCGSLRGSQPRLESR